MQDPAKPTQSSFKTDAKGAFVRTASTFRDFVSSEPGAKYPPEADRYHIYVNLACPWATGVLAMLEVKGLTQYFTVSNTKPEWGIVNEEGRGGWIFDEAAKTSQYEAIDHNFA
jgi:putative glutathione S-transferase